MPREVKVGLLVVSAFVLLGVGVFMVSERKNLFALKNRYFVRFETVSGLATGNPVQLNGVTVGSVQRVVLPEKIDRKLLTVWISVDRRFAERVRADSTAKIKTLGLLGDKYIEITSGSPEHPRIASGGEIPAAPATDVDKLIASGDDVVENVVAISFSLRTILGRMEAGEGLLGQLTVDSAEGLRARDAVLATVESVREVSDRLAAGRGTLGALLEDDALARSLESSAARLDTLLTSFAEGEGALPALLHDASTRERLEQAIGDLATVSSELSSLATELTRGEGLLPRLMADEELGQEVSEDLRRLIRNLESLSDKLERGEGTLGLLIEDPQVYEAINDVIVGINESRLLRWLVRNRQKAGIEKRYRDEQPSEAEAAAPLP